jgi:hypothetical protein
VHCYALLKLWGGKENHTLPANQRIVQNQHLVSGNQFDVLHLQYLGQVSVATVVVLRAGEVKNRGVVSDWAKGYLASKVSRPFLVPTAPPLGTRGSLTGVKTSGLETDHLPQS